MFETFFIGGWNVNINSNKAAFSGSFTSLQYSGGKCCGNILFAGWSCSMLHYMEHVNPVLNILTWLPKNAKGHQKKFEDEELLLDEDSTQMLQDLSTPLNVDRFVGTTANIPAP